jgi:hypothetical protein
MLTFSLNGECLNMHYNGKFSMSKVLQYVSSLNDELEFCWELTFISFTKCPKVPKTTLIKKLYELEI